jgi:hypothetical protein
LTPVVALHAGDLCGRRVRQVVNSVFATNSSIGSEIVGQRGGEILDQARQAAAEFTGSKIEAGLWPGDRKRAM